MTASRSSGWRRSSTISTSPAASPPASQPPAARGLALSNIILHGDAGMDLWPFDVRRFGAAACAGPLSRRRAPSRPMPPTTRSIGRREEIACRARPAALAAARTAAPERRGVRLEIRLGAAELVCAGRAAKRVELGSFEGKPGWFDAVGRRGERHPRARGADRPDLVLEIRDHRQGRARGAADASPPTICRAPPGKAVYTQLCNEKGGIEADVTIVHIADDLLLADHRLGLRRARRPLGGATPAGGRCDRAMSPNRYATINLCGPRAREILQSVTDDDVSNAAFSVPRRARRSRSATPRCSLCASAMSASLAGSSTCRRNMPPMSTTPCARQAKPYRHRQCRLSRHRRLPHGEGLSLLVRRHHARLQSLRGRLGFCRGARQGRVHRPRRAGEDQGGRRQAQAVLLHHRRLRAAAWRRGDPASTARSSARPPRPATATRSARRSPSAICRPTLAGETGFEIEAFGKAYVASTRPARALRSQDGEAEGMSDDTAARAERPSPAFRLLAGYRRGARPTRRPDQSRLQGRRLLPAHSRQGHRGIHQPRQRGCRGARGGAGRRQP